MRTGGYGLGLIAYHDIGGAISRNRHGKHNLIPFPFPFACDTAAYGMVLTFRPIQFFHEMRSDTDMTEARSRVVMIDTGQLVHHPSGDISHKDMVQGSVGKLRTKCPRLRQCGVTHRLYPISPRRCLSLRDHLHDILDIAIFRKHGRNGLTA